MEYFSPVGTPLKQLRSAADEYLRSEGVDLSVAQNHVALADCKLPWHALLNRCWSVDSEQLILKSNDLWLDLSECLGATVGSVTVDDSHSGAELAGPDGKFMSYSARYLIERVDGPDGREVVVLLLEFRPGFSENFEDFLIPKTGESAQHLINVIEKNTLADWARWAIRESETIMVTMDTELIQTSCEVDRVEILNSSEVISEQKAVFQAQVHNDYESLRMDVVRTTNGYLVVCTDHDANECLSVTLSEPEWERISSKLDAIEPEPDLDMESESIDLIREMVGFGGAGR